MIPTGRLRVVGPGEQLGATTDAVRDGARGLVLGRHGPDGVHRGYLEPAPGMVASTA
jgi:hypothetical protein